MLKARIILFFFLLTAITTAGQSREELEKQRREIQAEIEELRKAQSSIKQDKKASTKALAVIQNKLRKRLAVIKNISDQVNLIDNTIFTNNREIFRLKKQLDTLRLQYARTVEYAYKNRSNYDMLNFIFSSASFNDAIKRIAYLKSYRNYREEQVANIFKTRALMEQRIAVLAANKKEKSQVLEEQSKQMKTLEEEKNEQSLYVKKLKEREKEIEKEVAAKTRVERNLKNSIAAIVAREIKKAKEEADKLAKEKALAEKNSTKPSTTTTAPKSTRTASVLENTPEVTKISVGFENNRRSLPWPVDKGIITGRFGRHKIPELENIIQDNIGVYIQTALGANVKSVFEGSVSAVSDVAGSYAVTIRHGKYLTTYYNLTSVSVNKGDNVKLGQGLGKVAHSDDDDAVGELLFVVTVVVGNSSKFLDPELWLKNR
ncbi:MAG: peptidoglycan DD-metalloendopeptidase family protein [Chitinophagaceae bacterium]|nr:peptidoglycan DD-metalloendopeptidase family protein [Chitinophagaceae bacterium]